MAGRYGSGENIPTVGIQPSASPISTNILPAAGQPVRGNELQQIAESLAPFNQGLISFLGQSVKVMNTQAQQAGSNIDMTGIDSGLDNVDPAKKADEINKRFKALLQQSGGSDAANPYFQVGAEQNLGRTLAARYRTQMYAMKEQISDPNNPMSYAEASKKVAEQVIGDSLANNFYGFSAFRDTVEKYDTEMMAAFNAERVKRIEEQGALRAEEAVSEAAISGDAALMDGAWSSYQKVTTDPNRQRATWAKAVQSAFRGSGTVEQIDRVFDTFSSMKYGNQNVRDNLELYSDLAFMKDQATERLQTKADLAAKAAEAEYKRSQTWFNEAGGFKTIYDGVRDGQSQESLEQTVTGIVEKIASDKKMSVGAKDRLLQFALQQATSEAGRREQMNASASRPAYNKAINAVLAGQAKSIEDVLNMAQDAPPEMKKALITLYEEQSGALSGVVAATTSKVAEDAVAGFQQELVTYFPLGENGKPSPALAAEASYWVRAMRGRLDERVRSWLTGQVADSTRKTIEDYRAQGSAAVRAATVAYISETGGEIFDGMRQQIVENRTAGLEPKQGQWIKPPAQRYAYDPKAAAADVDPALKALRSGAGMQSPEVVRSMQERVTKLERLADVVDIGLFSSAQSPDDIGRNIAYYYFKSKAENDRQVMTNDSWVAGFLDLFNWWDLSDGITGETRPESWYSTFATYRDAPQLLRDYTEVRMMSGLSPEEVLGDVDKNGMTVFGAILPNKSDKESLLKAAFSVSVFSNFEEMWDDVKVNALMSALSVPQEQRAQWLDTQYHLLRLNREFKRGYQDWTGYGSFTTGEIKEMKSEYMRRLESAKKKKNQ